MDRGQFYANVRSQFGALKQSQVDGFETILNVHEKSYTARTPIAQLAYCLGTSWHETAQTMQPIKEYGNAAYFTRMYDIRGARPSVAKQLGNTTPGDGARYFGRGFVQLTGKRNYLLATVKLQGLGILKFTESLVDNPDLAMRPDVASAVLFEGMEDGWFTGVDLDDTIDANIDGDEHADFVRARKIINGKDRAELIAGYSDKFLAALRAAS
ncbi:hypothetical protein LMIY3S_03717 [Labrys miyagiensis]